MGNKSIKSSKKKDENINKKKKVFCCLCTSSFSINEKSLSTFDQISLNIDKNPKQTSYYCQSIEDLDKSLHITSLELIIKSNREFVNLNLFFISPPESILPNLLINKNHSYQIHEQIRSKCYFIPLTNCQIEPDDDEYKQKSILLDRTHVVITLENNSTVETNKIPIEFESAGIFISNDSFQTGFIRIDQEKLAKQFLPFIYFCSEENLFYLSSNLIQKWFNTLILVNQTCAIAKRFLIGDKNHITCLLKEQITNQEK
jgi:hypothetical protein